MTPRMVKYIWIVATYFLAFFAGAIAANMGILEKIVPSSPAKPTVQATTVSSTKVLDPIAAELVTDKYRGAAAYRCKEGYQVVQVPIGETKWSDTEFKLSEDRSYEQNSVVFAVTLPDTLAARAIIINTGAHKQYPSHAPQYKMEVNVPFGGSGSWTFQTSGYDRFTIAGITDITVCLTSKS